ncbi:MAG: type II toxin-antitoxin system death-on-curing family toxin [Thermomicrobia bacterium]|nr:type II toxin-antitoxin system death-on-curing family toxin [Thermomicrobia bacterium]MCA1723221.1 type II toxin-antitoxin system death-on-curing family toxin [Thermomicrobia bacterium]
MAVYLTLTDILGLHEFIMAKTGYLAAPLRDEEGLESAVMRAQTAAYYEDAVLIRQAAILAVGISQAQAFVDGNKRTALIAMDTFLEENGLLFIGDDLMVMEHFVRIAEEMDDREGTIDAFESWLRNTVRS